MEYWLWLSIIKGLGPILGKRLLAKFKDPRKIYAADKAELQTVKGIGDVLASAIISSRSLEKVYSILDRCEKLGIKLLTYSDPLYPGIAKSERSAPFLLFYKGVIKEGLEGVAIVGSRRCSDYGKEVAMMTAKYLAEDNIPVISGMAKGIDSYAHVACLKNDGYTIAFLGNGLDICYPVEHKELMEAIAEKGALVSEYPPGVRPQAMHFPRRNVLISSWSRKVLVVEAAQKSGALITAGIALKQGNELYVLPHEIHSNTGKGCNRLLLKGATAYLSPSQLKVGHGGRRFEREQKQEKKLELEPECKKRISPMEDAEDALFSATDEQILKCFGDKARTIEEIGIEVAINPSDLIERISMLELEGKITAVAGGKYKR